RPPRAARGNQFRGARHHRQQRQRARAAPARGHSARRCGSRGGDPGPGGVMTGQIPFLDVAAMTREIRDDADLAWRRVLASSRFIGGEAVEQFEAAWAGYCRVPHAVGVANGTDALQLTLTALGIGPGDEVIVPANTFVATAEAVVLAGAIPRFADVSPDTLLLTPEHLEAAITPRARAVIIVHLYGQMPDMD